MNELPLEAEHPSIDQVVDLLDAYADARLSPRGAVLARMRRHVLAEAAARDAAAESQRLATIAADTQRGSWIPLHAWRRVAAVGMAAALTLGTSAAVLAAQPGSPFYNARVQLEQAFLPQRIDDRVASIEQHLEDRLAEAQAAADRGDVVGLQAALDAYQNEVDAAVAELGWNADQLAHFEAQLALHTAKLEELAARLPQQAADNAIQHAIDVSQKATQKLRDKTHGKPSDPSQPSVPQGQQNQR